MPARSQVQRDFLAIHKGPAWMKAHHFDNKGPLPHRIGSAKNANERAAKRGKHNPTRYTRHASKTQKASEKSQGQITQTAEQERLARMALARAGRR